MATKHINDELWKRVEQLAVKANAMHGLVRPIKEADVLHMVLQRGLELVTEDDLALLGHYQRPMGFLMRRSGGEELVRMDRLTAQDAAKVVLRSGPVTVCIWSPDDIFRESSEETFRELLPDAVILSEGYDRAEFQTLLPGYWNAQYRGETGVISLRADSADHAISRITDLMCESLLGWKGQRAYRAYRPDED
ncbi:hypothetical protein [Klebsiella pneumoniae]|uniref:hypothetical protein n=1 Tax=Enterobacteriaceae TaxID=543 RepID=UPI000E2BB431|nr:hypothetical protein [Klebsiella pneumoniae]UMJ84912.1 hypothetical protein JJ436_30115 [Klebsiella pneumoniae]SYT90306.1 Uncharacterised protein [Klebsiella pneumoniae]VGE63222.1 Uncharacterised protein [Klebsiella pneumoniae]HBR5084188.1 hypothetical protein [Klebsiella pneumoniae]HCI4242693.1 hypothetical protein [Klebsiella pneumoniae]